MCMLTGNVAYWLPSAYFEHRIAHIWSEKRNHGAGPSGSLGDPLTARGEFPRIPSVMKLASDLMKLQFICAKLLQRLCATRRANI